MSALVSIKSVQQAVEMFGEYFPYNTPEYKKVLEDMIGSLAVPKSNLSLTEYINKRGIK